MTLSVLDRRALHPAHRTALWLAGRKGGAIVSTVSPLPKGTVSARVAGRLVQAGWADQHGDTLITTTLGRRKLSAPIPEGPDVFLRIRDGLTTNRGDAELGEGPILDAHTLRPFWKEQALRNRAATQDGRQHARQLKRSARNWPTTGPIGPVTTRFDPSVIRDADAA